MQLVRKHSGSYTPSIRVDEGHNENGKGKNIHSQYCLQVTCLLGDGHAGSYTLHCDTKEGNNELNTYSRLALLLTMVSL